MKKITLLFLLMFGLSGLVNGQNTVKKLQSSSPSVVNYQNSNFGNDFARLVGCDGVLPNYTNSMLTGSGVASQIFPDFANSTLQSADDFMVVGTQDALICQIDVSGIFYNGATTLDGAGTSIQMTIYDDNAGIPGIAIFSENFPGSIAGPMSASFSLSPTGAPTLSAGTTYWMSIQVIMPFNPSGQWGWESTTDGNGSGYMFQDPDAIAGGCPSWALGSTCTSDTGTDLAMDISFNAVGGGGGSCTVAESFITTWKTTAPGETITIPTFPTESYSYTVDWGDSSSTVHIGDATHMYANAGTYTVKICGTFPRIYFDNGGDALKLLTIEQWGPNVWSSMNAAFAGARNLVSNATDMPNLSMVNDMYGMFAYASNFNGDANFGNWNVSNVTDMSAMFAGASKFNTNINGWDVSNVTTMEDMFNGASIFNKDLNGWDVGNVTNMTKTFMAALKFNRPLNNWDVSNVTTMRRMFSFAGKFNQDLSSWDVSNVINMRNVFAHANMFNGAVGNWDVSSATDMYGMFSYAGEFNQNIGSWNVENVTDMTGMFAYARKFNQNIGGWDVGNVTNMYGMFAAASVFNSNINAWNVANVTNMMNMFNGATVFNQPLDNWNVGSVKNMENMYRTALNFNQDISNWDVSSVTNMDFAFAFATSFDQNIGSWNVSEVASARNMFKGVTLSVSNYDALLLGWYNLSQSPQGLKDGVKFSAGNSKYCNEGDKKDFLINNSPFWIITDGGADLGCPDYGRLSVSDNEQLSAITIYPNPMQNEVILANPKNVKLENVSIYDVTGRLIQTVDLRSMNSEMILDVSNLSPATYLVLINGEAGQISKLVIKQ